MQLAFCLFRYFPFGGLQRDFLRIARTCLDRGHQVEVFTLAWEGEAPPGLKVHLVPGRGLTNHARCLGFTRRLASTLDQGGFDAVVGFNKMPGLDLYFAADPCYRERVRLTRGPWYRLGPRYRTYAALEEAVFASSAKTEILLIAPAEKDKFIRWYGTPEKRFHLLPPGITKDRVAPPDAGEVRSAVRRELGLGADDLMVLLVGSAFKTKGLDRAIVALAGLPGPLRERTKLYVIGRGKGRPFEKLANRLGVAEKLHLLGGREDVPRFLFGADLLLHPAYTENTGTVLVEALAAGLPVLATEVCGYAFHVRESGAGRLTCAPFDQRELNGLLEFMLTSPERSAWKRNALDYAARADLFSLPEKAVDLIETAARKRKAS